jgi:hypothetical protein
MCEETMLRAELRRCTSVADAARIMNSATDEVCQQLMQDMFMRGFVDDDDPDDDDAWY